MTRNRAIIAAVLLTAIAVQCVLWMDDGSVREVEASGIPTPSSPLPTPQRPPMQADPNDPEWPIWEGPIFWNLGGFEICPLPPRW